MHSLNILLHAEEAATKPGPSKSLSEVFDPSDDPNEAMDT